MTQARARAHLSWLGGILAALALALIIVAGFDSSGASGACASWGQCSGWSFLAHSAGPIGTLHLVVAGLIGLATITLLAISRLVRNDTRVNAIALGATTLILIQLSMIFVPANGAAAIWAASIHLGATALLLACALALIQPLVAASDISTMPATAARAWFRPLVAGATVVLFAVLVSGAYLAASDASSACANWPACGLSMGQPLVGQISTLAVHQILVGTAIALLALVLLIGAHLRVATPLLIGLAAVFAVEIPIGALNASGAPPAAISTLHFGVAGIAWALLVQILLLTRTAPSEAAAAPGAVRDVLRDYFRVTKPAIMLLLLTTTLGAMLIAGAGWPPLSLILLTLLGGAFASGGASAMNCYIDRDIDVVMSRTRKRPIPTGRLTGDQVFMFALLLSALAVVVLALFVNPLAALLALAGNLFYVLIYTRWLKRSTPQNIVIGGAAGAFPPLVGWAAVTGSLNLTAVLLFAIIYYWTPPHFWSLALLKARDYQRAGVPMLPVTHGDAHTRRMILLYALQLVAITLLLVPAGYVGSIYLVAAIVLGGIFLSYAARMYVEGTSRLAWRLFKYSNYYLAALLLAMVVDRALTR
ncbi:MAG: heme o synthase [Thermomicrobiales bacterium]